MGAKVKKALMKKVKKSSSNLAISSRSESSEFLPLEGGPGRKFPKVSKQENEEKNTATVVYIGRIPHGFYEDQMQGFFSQFGKIKNLKISRNKKTGKSKHYGFIEFESPEVAKIVADSMHNYLLFEHMLQVHLVPTEQVHPNLWKLKNPIYCHHACNKPLLLRKRIRHSKLTKWKGANRKYQPLNLLKIERERHDKERTVEEHRRLVERILKRDKKRSQKIRAAGIDYECPEIVGGFQPTPKKIKFEEDEE